jgi:type IV secretory pathway VirJ component
MKGALPLVLAALLPAVVAGDELSVTVDRFGTVPLLQGAPPPAPVILFVSGDAGISPNVNGMAHELAKLGALVAVVDIWRYLHALDRMPDPCTSPAKDFEALAHAAETQAGYPAYRVPVLVGFSSGATLVYAVLVQGTPGTFRGAVSLGFCPDLPVKKPFCAGNGLRLAAGPGGKGFTFAPDGRLSVPWIAFQGSGDEDCLPENTRRYVAQVKGGEIVEIPETDHYFHQRQAWIPQLKQVLDRLEAAPAAPLGTAFGPPR